MPHQINSQTIAVFAAIALLPDGSLLISDDHAGAIYRITYSNENKR